MSDTTEQIVSTLLKLFTHYNIYSYAVAECSLTTPPRGGGDGRPIRILYICLISQITFNRLFYEYLIQVTNLAKQVNSTPAFPQNRRWTSRFIQIFMFPFTSLKLVRIVPISNGQINRDFRGNAHAANATRHTCKVLSPILPISTNDGSAGSIQDACPHSRTYESTE